MLQIHHAESDQTPTKAYADACWAANPRLSPDWWRELLGHTVGKIALDWRVSITNPTHLATGCNLVLATPATWSQTIPYLSPAVLSALIVEDLTTLPEVLPTWLIWNPQDEVLPALTKLENLVKAGAIEAYGILLDDQPLHHWLEQAALAAEATWGRKKRPALKVVVGAMDLLDLDLLHAPTTEHKGEPVSALELAARLSLATLILPASLPEQSLEATPAALQALTAATQAEFTLHEALAGWPAIGGQQLFNLLAPLSRGQSPWPTPVHWQGWLTHLWPQLQTHWNTFAQTFPQPALIEAYLHALQNLIPHGENLALASAQPLLAHLLEIRQSFFPAAWQSQPPLLQTLAVLSSIPGVGAVAVSQPFNPEPLQHLGDIPDPAPLLGA